jgi:hypothetical protein
MSSEPHDHTHEPADTGAFIHRAKALPLPLAALAATLTALHAQGIAYTIGGVVLWLLAVVMLTTAAEHDWRACSLCDGPPRAEATPEARARLARRDHSRAWRLTERLVIAALLLHAVLPKPYMDPWWTPIPAAVLYLLTSVLLGRAAYVHTVHRRNREECHVEWCRAGLDRKPGHRRFDMWSGHYGVWTIAVLAPTACALGLYSQVHHSLHLKAVYGLSLLVLGMVTGQMVIVHADEPCVRCARSLPSNGGDAAERRMRWLRLFHQTGPWLLVCACLSWVASWALAGHAVAKVAVCAAALTLVVWAVLSRVHAPVRPWCPWCRDDDGDDAHTLTPDPSTHVPA